MKKHNKRSKTGILFLIMGGILVGIAIGNIFPEYIDKRISANTYDNLRKTYVQYSDPENEEEKEEWWLTQVSIDLEEIQKENPDVVAWIRSDDQEATGIDYPILYSGDNETYLHKDIYGKYRIAGSIFLEGMNAPDFQDYYNILYGHNMKDGTMFGKLKAYKQKDFWEKHQYFTLYTGSTVYRYRIFACQNAVNGGRVYQVGYQPGEAYQDFIDSILGNSLINTGIYPDCNSRMITLSTCTGNGYENRFAVHAVCVDAQSVLY